MQRAARSAKSNSVEIGEGTTQGAQPRSRTRWTCAGVIIYFLPWMIGDRHDVAEFKREELGSVVFWVLRVDSFLA